MLAHLDRGEQQAIVLAQEYNADILLMDERAGVAAARARGLRVTGTLGVLDRGAARGLVDLKAVFARLQQTTFRSPIKLMAAMLQNDAERRP